jgi:hypothetical protein
MSSKIPALYNFLTAKQFYADGQPFLNCGVELHNSSMTSANYMKAAWPKPTKANVNTVLLPWDIIELEERKFTFDELDKAIGGARHHGLRLRFI